MKKLSIILCLIWTFQSSFAQSDYSIKGVVQDTLGNSLISATALLLEKSDSTLIDFTRTELDGSFKFKNVKPGNHLVKFTYVGFLPKTIDVSSTPGNDIDLGTIQMSEFASELMEVVIKAAKASMKMRGDTIEYDASTFQVPEGSSVEDLLKRLPGIEIEQDGSILSDGKAVSKVTVDGKSFFGSDPKAATKNLPAESISKVQVFDTKTEEDEITGGTSEATDKTMNLDLKEGFKKGGFGKVVAGAGTESTAEIKGNYNKFNDKIQFSIVGVGNNTGRNGLNWDDYQDFMGSNSWNFGEGTEYGFGGRGGFYTITFGGGEDDIESSIQSIFFGGNRGGFPENYNGGINFNYDHNKNKLSSVYYYNQAGLDKTTNSNQRNFYQDFTTEQKSFREDSDLSKGHRAELSFEKEIDSLHTIIISADLAAVDKLENSIGNTNLSRDGQLSTLNEYNNILNTNGYLANSEVIFRKKFMKKGRRMGLNASYLLTQLEKDGDQSSVINFYEATDTTTLNIDQLTNNVADKNVFKANALFVEPLSKRFYLQTFYNYSHRNEDGDRDVLDVEAGNGVLNGFLSRTYENTIAKNRIGSSLRYSHNGMNVSIGLAYQAFKLDGLFEGKGNNGLMGTVDKKYENWIPNLSFNMSPVRNSYLSFGYSVGAQEPSINNLQAIVDNSNPLYIREGNPDLVPTLSHVISGSYRMNMPASSIRFNVNGSYTYFEDQLIYDVTIDDNLITTTKPINYTGGTRFQANVSLNMPIIKNKITARMGLWSTASKSFSQVNDILNKTNTIAYRPSIRLNITPHPNFSTYINGSLNLTDTKYDINTSEDQQTTNQNLGIEVNAKTFWGVYFSTNFDYQRIQNDRFDVDQSVPILNASIYKQFLPKNALEVRMSLYDAFNRNQSVSQSASGYGVSETRVTALARYVMVSLAYNIRGMKSGVTKDSWW